MTATNNNQQFQSRVLMLGDYVDSGSVGGLIKQIVQFNMYDDYMETQQKGYERQAIIMIVNSFGGSVYDGFGLVGAIELSSTPVITVCIGSAMSMGFAVFISGHQRLVYEYSSLMYHEIWSGGFGKLTEQKIAMEEMERLQLQYDMLVLSKTKISETRLNEVRKNKDDWFMDATEAVKYGVADLLVNEPILWSKG